MEKDLKVINTAKLKPCVILGDFKYCFQKQNKNETLHFRCSDRDSKCTASITTNSAMTTVLRESEHTCLPDPDKIKVELVMYSCKQKVAESFEPIQPLFEDSLQELDGMHHSILLPTFSSTKDSLYAHRKRVLGTETLRFENPKDVKIPKIISDNFLVCQSGDDDRILIFCSDLAKRTIKKTHIFLADGTFKIVPKPFSQLYTIHAVLNNESESRRTIVPIIYALLPNKLESTYIRLFEELKTALAVNIRDFKADYELAAMNAVSYVFPSAKITGCFFHFMKAVWTKSKELNIDNGKDGNKFAKLLTYLPLLPNDYIPKGWEILLEKSSHINNIQKWRKYFESYWMNVITPNIFGCSEETYRTTNHLEGWHNRLNKKLSKKPNIHHFLMKLKSEARHHDIGIKQAQAHKERKRSRKVDL